MIAIVLRGDRGLELNFDVAQRTNKDCDRSSGRSRIGTLRRIGPIAFRTYCDRSSGRSRIGTRHSARALRASDCDRSSGRSRIGTPSIVSGALSLSIAIVLRGDRGLEQGRSSELWHGKRHCDRSSGRSRIGTRCNPKPHEPWKDCDRSSGRSRIGTDRASFLSFVVIAIVLRGDRGLELNCWELFAWRAHCDRSSGRSRIGTSTTQ